MRRPDRTVIEEMIKRMDITPVMLLDMEEDTFRQMVDTDLRGRGTPALTQSLRSTEVVDRWYSTLKIMEASVEGQIEARQADSEAFELEINHQIQSALERADHKEVANLESEREAYRLKDARWKPGVLRFKTGLEEALSVAMRLREKRREEIYESGLLHERNKLQARVNLLEKAIRDHRSHDCDEDQRCAEYCAGDDDLYTILGG